MNKKLYTVLGVFVIIVILIGPTLWHWYKDGKKESLLENDKYNWGILEEKYTVTRGGDYFKISHFVDGNRIVTDDFRPAQCYNKIHVGDTVFIRYSISNPKVVSVESCYWNPDDHWYQIKKSQEQ